MSQQLPQVTSVAYLPFHSDEPKKLCTRALFLRNCPKNHRWMPHESLMEDEEILAQLEDGRVVNERR